MWLTEIALKSWNGTSLTANCNFPGGYISKSSHPPDLLGLGVVSARCLMWFVIAVVALRGQALAVLPEWGRPVTHIRLDCDARLSLDQFKDQITQKVGEPMDQSKVSESLKRLYATGRFRELRADVGPKDGGVELVFVGRAALFVGAVEVEGTPKPLDSRTLANAARLRLGQAIFEDELAAATRRMVDVLTQNGYYQAQVGYRLLRDRNNQEAQVLFSLAPGQPARLRGVEFQGNTLSPPQRLAAVARWRPGGHLTSARIERGLFNLHKFYVSQGRLQGTVTLEKRIYDPMSRTETLRVRVEPGPLIRVRVEGAQIANSKLRQLLPVFRDGVVDDPALEQGGRSLEDYLQRRGYFSAAVKAQRVYHADSHAYDIQHRVTLGPRGEFAGYGFRGNRAVPTADLETALTEESSGASGPHKLFSQELLARHVQSLEALYRSRGFLEARITPRRDDHYGDHTGRLFVTFDTEEGLETTVRDLALRGVGEDVARKIQPRLLTQPGQPYSPERAQSDRDLILSDLADLGYSHATVSWHASTVSDSHEVEVEYQIDPGLQERIQQVVVLGNQHTHDGTIRRVLVVRPGGPLRQSDLLESQRRLYELGIFNQVQISTQDPESSETEKTVLVNVEETRRWTVGYGGGIEFQRLGGNQPEGQFKASPRLSLDIGRLNLGGRAQSLTLRGRLSNLDSGGAINYDIAHLPTARDMRLRFSGLVDRSRDVLTFTAEREEGSVSIEDHYSPATLFLGRLSFRRVLVDRTTLRIRREDIPLLSLPARVAMLAASYIKDRRDNPADATQGSYALVDAGTSWDKLGSESNFLRFSGQHASYYRLGKRLIFARNTRFQVESPFGELRSTLITDGPQAGRVIRSHDIPLPERFFMGGSESHRGFSINQAGPRDPVTGFPIGGNALFFNSLELRLPAMERRFGFVFFHDAGNVFSTVRKMRLLKVTQSVPTDFDYMAHAIGLGIRYKTPVGPLRFDVGYNLNPPRFQVVDASNPNIPLVEVRRLSRFQFFLSIGQSF